ncbi:MAG: DnaJ domain-containing protein [Candidatus Aminicenantes bacterium]|nr:DnaJ domain-containing protein [Candidatus Aminicenantes bacterium]
MEKTVNITYFLRKLLKTPKTGRLIVEKNKLRREFYFTDSFLTYSISNSPEEKFGKFLHLFGVHLPENVEKSIREGKYKSRVGKHLVELGFIDEKLLNQILKHQTKEILIAAIGEFNIKYRWDANVSSPNQSFSADLPLLPLIIEGLRRIEDYESLKNILRGEVEPEVAFDSSLLKNLSELEYKIFQKIKEGEKPKPEDFNISPEKFNKIIFTLLALGFIRIKGERDELSDLEKVYSKLGVANYWELLGVPMNADTTAIKNSYYALSKKFHPDKFASYGEQAKEMASKVFSELTRAFETLTNPKKKKEYVEKTRPVVAKGEEEETPARITPEERFKEGKLMFNRKKYREAAYLFEIASKMEPNNYKYLYWLGLALSRQLGKEKEAEEALTKAAELSPWDAQPYVAMASMYAKRRLTSKALKLLNKALSIDPTHPTALKLKSTLEKKTKKKGFLDFFKK